MNWSPVPDFASPKRPARVALAVTLLVAALQTVYSWTKLPLALGDTDDALRLVIVRNLLTGGHWFDTHIERLQPPAGLDMHWSRLLDGAMALVYGGFALVVPAETAELLFRLIWPLLWVFPLTLGAVLAARRLGGSTAVLAAATFVASIPVQMQFHPGRIDHHNAQIALSMLVLAGALHLETRWGPWLAGIATGLLLAIGLEAVVFAILCGAKIALRFADHADYARPARRYALGLGATALLAFFAQTPPHLWTVTACDMLSVNLLAGVVVGAVGLFLASFVRGGAVPRLGAVLTAGALALGVYIALDPACLKGPFAHMDPRLRGYWLDHVVEVMNWLQFYGTRPALAAALLAPSLIAIIGFSIAVIRDRTLLRNPAWILVLALFVAGLLSGLFAIRALSYASAFGAVLFAGAFPRLLPHRLSSTLVAAALSAFLVSPSPVAVLAAMIAKPVAAQDEADRQQCSEAASFTQLAALPPGLVLSTIDAGPNLLAYTKLSALAAPYHRMNEGIATAHDLWSAPAADAAQRLKARGIDYVLLCPGRGPLPFGFPPGSLKTTLDANTSPPGLVSVPAGPAFRLWQVR
jgi:hypothetical protein